MSWGISYPDVMKSFEKRNPDKYNCLQSLSLRMKNKEIRAMTASRKRETKETSIEVFLEIEGVI
jgi:hypothetical protein